MSWKSGSKGGRTKGGSWSGAGPSREQPLHRWQDPGTASQGSRSQGRRHRNRWLIVTALGLCLLGSLVYLLLSVQRVTPLVVITATHYPLPAPLNPWAVEDREALEALDGENMSVADISDQWNKRRDATGQLIQETVNLGRGSRDGAPLIVHISMHGVVNDEGKPCLLPPGGAPADTKNWKRVDAVLKEIKEAVGGSRNILVIFDSNRIRANWHLGIVYNTFVERLEQVVKENSAPNLAVLCSASPGQVNWASADLHGSAFGRHLQLGLAGEADTGEGGDGDGAVSLHELAAYLQREVDAWSRFNRDEPQIPVLMPAGVADFRLTWCVAERKRRKLADELYDLKPASPAVSPAAISRLWSQLDQLRTLDLVRQDPIACRDLEHGLLRLEGLSQGGSAYADEARRQRAELEAKLSGAVARAQTAAKSRAVADHLGFATTTTWARIPVAVHALPVAEYFGACNADLSKRVESLWAKLIDTANAGNPLTIIEQAGEEERSIARDLGETQLLIAARQQDVVSLWPQTAVELRDMLQLRNLAEELAVPRRPDGVPGDERAHYYARYAAEAADQQRRLAEDVLFIGERHAPRHYAELAAEARELYDWTSKVMQDASEAYAVHDVALAEAPYLAAWLCGPAMASIPDRDKLVNQRLSGLIRGSRQLGTALSQLEKLSEPNYLPKEGDLPFGEQTEVAKADYQSLRQEFDRACEQLLEGGAQGTAGRGGIEAALSAPLVPAKAREQLLVKHTKVSSELHKQFVALKKKGTLAGNDSTEKQAASALDSKSSYLVAMSGWGSHPLVEILLPGESETADKDIAWCDGVAARLRGRLAQIPASSSQNSEPTENTADNAVFRDRHKLSRAERELRASAAVDVDPGSGITDPVLNLREFDLRQLLVWHGQRATDDFWGDAPPDPADKPFFARAAKHYFDAARNLGKPTFAVGQQISKAEARLEQRVFAKCQPLEIGAETQLVNETTGDVAVRLDVGTKSDAYPAGRGALYLKGQPGRLTEFQLGGSTPASNLFVAFPPPAAAQSFEIALSTASLHSPRMEAVAFFRGREDSSGNIPLPALKGVRIAYQPHRYSRQSIQLSGDRPERLSLVFILDCSHSMDEKMKVEAGETKRMELAKNNFGAMLSEIANRNLNGDDTRVGVRFFGHRLGWLTPPKPTPPGWTTRLMRQVKYTGRIPDDITPSEDVEPVYTLGRFDRNAADGISRRLKSVEPWGETPLYLSLIQALDDFESDERDTRKSIIAITDGEDKQSLINLSGPKPRRTTLEMLLASWHPRKVPIPIHILGFDIEESEAAQARADYKRVADVTGGSYTEIESGSDLLNHLREHLNVAGYIVKDASGVPVNAVQGSVPEQAKLGSRIAISNRYRLPQEFQVEFRMVPLKPVVLEGGEAIQLHVVEKGSSQDIVAKRYELSVVASDNLSNGPNGRPTKYILRVHRPVRRESSVDFKISLQRDPGVSHFTPRPAETWLEVTPTSEEGSDQSDPYASYPFYDTNFAEDEPVPVLEWEAIDWPENANKARIKFWCKHDPTDPVQTIPLRDSTYRKFQNVPDVSGVQLKVETREETGGKYRVYVVETHGPQSPGVGALRVQFQTDPRYKPIQVTHQFDRETRMVTHSFYFPLEWREWIERFEGSHVVVTSAADIKKGALQLPGDSGLEVPIDPVRGFHTTGPAASGQ